MKATQSNQTVKVGDKVTFDNDKIEIFKSETSSNDKAIRQYQQMVLGGNLTTVSYPDGWVLPVPTKYLIILP
jgi:hypothetical protein